MRDLEEDGSCFALEGGTPRTPSPAPHQLWAERSDHCGRGASSWKEGPLGAQSRHCPGPARPPRSPLTVLLRVQAVEAVGAQEDVGLPLQGLAERVAALRHHVVKDAAGREDVHRVGLERNAGVRGSSGGDAAAPSTSEVSRENRRTGGNGSGRPAGKGLWSRPPGTPKALNGSAPQHPRPQMRMPQGAAAKMTTWKWWLKPALRSQEAALL